MRAVRAVRAVCAVCAVCAVYTQSLSLFVMRSKMWSTCRRWGTFCVRACRSWAWRRSWRRSTACSWPCPPTRDGTSPPLHHAVVAATAIVVSPLLTSAPCTTKGRLDDLALVHSIRGTGNLDPVQLGVMGALFLWRDAKAREFDRPCGSVISNERLVKIARALDPDIARRYTHTHTHTHHRTRTRTTHTARAHGVRLRRSSLTQVRP